MTNRVSCWSFVFVFIAPMFVPMFVNAAVIKSHWTLELDMGVFEPKDEQWSTYYGSRRMLVAGGSLAYRLLNVLDLGMSVNYGEDRGSGFLPISGIQSGDVTYRMVPVELFALLRLKFSEGQWIVPYGGGGYTRFAYHQSIVGQSSTRGSANGYHFRAGLQLLLDPLDKSAAKQMFRAYGAVNSYLYVEFKRTEVEVDLVGASASDDPFQLGGNSIKSGLMIEFR